MNNKGMIISFCYMLLTVLFSIAIEADTVGNDIIREDINITTEDFISKLKEENKVVISNDTNSLNTITIDNQDGTNTIYLFNNDIRYENEDGRIVDKDLSLIASGDNKRISTGHILKVKSNNIESFYPINMKNHGIVVENIEIIPSDSSAVLKGVSDDGAMYENVFEGIDYTFKPEFDGASADIYLDNIQLLNDIKYNIIKNETDKIYSRDGLIVIEGDKYTYEITGGSILNSNEQEIGMSTVELTENNEVVMQYELDTEAVVEESVSTSISISIQKRYIFSTTVFEDAVYVEDGYDYIGTKTGYGMARTFIKFDLSSIQDIPYDSIVSAYYYTKTADGNNNDIAEVYLATSEWDWYLDNVGYMPKIDYNNKIVNLCMKSVIPYDFDKQIYITSAVQAWLQGYDNNGIMIKARNDNGWMKFESSANENNSAYLAITYSNNSDVPLTKGIERGEEYYIHSKKTKEVIKVVDYIPPAEVTLEKFSMSDLEGWHVMYDSTVDGVEYFKLRAMQSTGFLEAAATGNDENNGVNITVANNADNQRWQIIRNWNGSYKIIPKSSNGTKALTIQVDENGESQLMLESITIDSDESDDWTFLPVSKGDAALYGLCSECWNLDMQNEIQNVKTYLNNSGYNCVNYHNCELNSDELISDEITSDKMAYRYLLKMFESDIWYSSTHGFESRIAFKECQSPYTESRIGPISTTEPDDEDETEELANVYGISDFDGNLNKLQFAFMNSCLTGKNNGEESLIGTMYEEGAHCLIAHIESVDVPSVKAWQKYFNLAFSVYDLKSAITFADRMMLGTGNIGEWASKHILGNTDFFCNYSKNTINEDSEVYLKNDNNLIPEIADIEYTIAENNNETTAASFNEMYYEFDENGNIHGYSSELKEKEDIEVQLLYSFYDKYNELGNNEIENVTAALVLAREFITEEMNFVITSDHVVTYTGNTYSPEFIYECTNTNAGKNQIEKMVVHVEEDGDDNQFVTFFLAQYGE